ncbi:MAG: phosphate ABC transporter permease subunit PstC [Coriobacteriia bacterium]|nr:phosphate ABC transporter permease subunit PstC [Coriobacteriia bacterium]
MTGDEMSATAVPSIGASTKTPTVDLSSRVKRVGEHVAAPVLAACAIFSGALVTLVIAYVFRYAAPLFATQGLAFVTTGDWDTAIDIAWSESAVVFGALPLIIGTTLTTLGALAVSVVLGLGCAIFIAELAPDWLRTPLESVVQLMAGIPSVVFGLVGLAVVVPVLTKLVPADAMDVVPDVPLEGASLLAGVLVLSFMILPFFVTVAVDSLRAVPRGFFEGGLALGMHRWRAITRIQVPAAAPGLLAGAVLAAARAIGEAIALSMVAGSIAFIPSMEWGVQYFPFMPIRTMASAIVETGGEAMSIPDIEAALFGLAALLLVASLSLSLFARWIVDWYRRRLSLDTGRSL